MISGWKKRYSEILKEFKYSEKTDKKTLLAFAFTEFHIPMCFYITYIFLGDFMKENLDMSPIQVINHNLKISRVLK